VAAIERHADPVGSIRFVRTANRASGNRPARTRRQLDPSAVYDRPLDRTEGFLLEARFGTHRSLPAPSQSVRCTG